MTGWKFNYDAKSYYSFSIRSS